MLKPNDLNISNHAEYPIAVHVSYKSTMYQLQTQSNYVWQSGSNSSSYTNTAPMLHALFHV